jgi:hypothetical protein
VTDGAEEPAGRRLGGRVPPRGPAPLAADQQGSLGARAGSSTGGDRACEPRLRADLERDRRDDRRGRDALLRRAARYARWDGTQTIPALDADEILDALADDVMAEGDLARPSAA